MDIGGGPADKAGVRQNRQFHKRNVIGLDRAAAAIIGLLRIGFGRVSFLFGLC